MAHHTLDDRLEHVTWGFMDASIGPVLTVTSGDTVTLDALPAGFEPRLPEDQSRVLPSHRALIEDRNSYLGAHVVTGPVFVEDAEPGDVLQIDILGIEFRQDWGFVTVHPLLGTLVGEVEKAETIFPDIDRNARICTLPWGRQLPLNPFFGLIGVAPPASWGAVSTNPPRAFGGNMDNKELTVGTTLYLPVFNAGALFVAGDGHAVQGDGEVCISALETALSGTFRLTVRKDLSYRSPFAENETHLISIGIDEDLDDAAKSAVRQMVEAIVERTDLTWNHAYMLCSLAADLRVTQTVDGNKGCHMMLPKSAL